MDTYEINVAERLRPSIERKLTGTTKSDTEIAGLDIPKNPFSVRLSVLFIRLYRKLMPFSIRSRCVFEPSCSHYSEMAIRKYGLLQGGIKTIQRLHRCKPNNGGIDLP